MPPLLQFYDKPDVIVINPFNFGGGGSFSPIDLSPIQWLADTGASAGTWPDLSGNGWDGVQASAPQQPAIVPAAQNGRQARLFDGVNSELTHGLTVAGDSDLFVVVRDDRASAPTAFEPIYSAAAAGSPLKCYLAVSMPPITPFWGTYRSTAHNSGQSLIGAGWVLLRMQTTATGGEFWMNGVSAGSYSDTTYFSDGIDRRRIGASASGFSFEALFKGYMGEVILFNALSAPDAANVTTYLMNGWGL